MSSSETAGEREDPIKLHREGTALSDVGNHKEAAEKFSRASELYEKAKNFFDASYALFKAAECNFILRDYSTATERFLKAADLAFKVGYDRFGLSALEYALDCYKATGEKGKAAELEKKIKEVKDKLSTL
jgi:tetratricopeptide (TPR) repeat protein